MTILIFVSVIAFSVSRWKMYWQGRMLFGNWNGIIPTFKW